MQPAVKQCQIFSCQSEVDDIGLHRQTIRDFQDRHARALLEKTWKQTGMSWRLVGNHHEGYPAIRGHLGKEFLKGFEPARRGPDSHDRKAGLKLPNFKGRRTFHDLGFTPRAGA